ncbi:MAG: hypothetical protein WCI41_02260 [bacterium]
MKKNTLKLFTFISKQFETFYSVLFEFDKKGFGNLKRLLMLAISLFGSILELIVVMVIIFLIKLSIPENLTHFLFLSLLVINGLLAIWGYKRFKFLEINSNSIERLKKLTH